MFTKRLLFVLMIAALVLPALAITPSASAQEGPKPEAVGLRPDAPAYAVHGPYWVGVREFDAQTDFHPTRVAIWYPALNPNGAPETITYHQATNFIGMDLILEGHALENASPQLAGGPYPLVLFAHGNRGLRYYAAYLTEHLASYGFVVMAIEYGDSAMFTGYVDGDLSNYTRPKDVSWQIDYAEQLTGAGGTLPGLIDTQHIAVVGHSFGAYTAQMAGGAQLDLSGPTSWCVQYPDQTLPPEMGDPRPWRDLCASMTRTLVKAAGLPTAPEGLWPAWSDSRVNAIVPLAPEMVEFGSESFRQMTIPVMMLSGSKDRFERSDLPLYQQYLYDNLGSATKSFVSLANADHLVFEPKCETVPWATEIQASWFCSDPVWDMDRAHDLINHFTTTFLLATLKGDSDAAAALAPDAVSFPGITYETTGF